MILNSFDLHDVSRRNYVFIEEVSKELVSKELVSKELVSVYVDGHRLYPSILAIRRYRVQVSL